MFIRHYEQILTVFPVFFKGPSDRESSVPEVDPKVMTFVEETLKKSPKIQLEELFERAKKVSGSIRTLSKRQFNARYPLQVKRRKSQSKRKRSGKPRKTAGAAKTRTSTPRSAPNPGAPRDAVRKVLLDFATDITGAEDRKDLVKVLANVDRYVERVLKGAS